MNRTFTNSRISRRSSVRGFSVVELLICIAFMMVIMGITIVKMQPAVQQFHADGAANVILGQLRYARQLSIAQRRDIQVQFLGNNEIKLTRQEIGGGQTVISDIHLTSNVYYMTFPTEPDTPDGFGDAGAIDFGGIVGGPPFMQFQSDGTFINGNGTPLNGTVFLGVANIPTSARAVTVLGTTGQVRSYRGTGAGWVAQ